MFTDLLAQFEAVSNQLWAENQELKDANWGLMQDNAALKPIDRGGLEALTYGQQSRAVPAEQSSGMMTREWLYSTREMSTQGTQVNDALSMDGTQSYTGQNNAFFSMESDYTLTGDLYNTAESNEFHQDE